MNSQLKIKTEHFQFVDNKNEACTLQFNRRVEEYKYNGYILIIENLRKKFIQIFENVVFQLVLDFYCCSTHRFN